MSNSHSHSPAPAAPEGVARVVNLPSEEFSDHWDSLILPDGMKDRLVNHSLFSLLHRSELRATRTALQGLVLFSGPPGTGKTTAGRGLANEVAEKLADRGTTGYIEVDPHSLPSELLGESQRKTARLLDRSLPELAGANTYTIVLVDEVEAFAASRSRASFETNPVDVHRSTDAVLTGLDTLAASHPRILIIATTNVPEAVDEALVSRADLVIGFEPPSAEHATAIVRDTLLELARTWPTLAPLTEDAPGLEAIGKRCAGMDGRRIRKVVIAALTADTGTSRDPSRLRLEDVLASAEATALPHAASSSW